MAKSMFTKEFECYQSNKNKNNSNIVFANNIQQAEGKIIAREVINLTLPGNQLANIFEPGKKYTVTITEE